MKRLFLNLFAFVSALAFVLIIFYFNKNNIFDYYFNSLESFEGLENLTNIGDKLTIKGCSSLNNIDALKNIESLNDISITTCSKLYDFCVLKNVVQNMSGTFYVNDNGYNPTKYQLLNGECSQIPQE